MERRIPSILSFLSGAWSKVPLWVAAFFLLGAVIRGVRFFGRFGLWAHWDEVRLAIPAIGILNGDFPIHHLGVEYMGASPSYFLAPWFLLFGFSPVSLDLFAYGAGLFMFGTGYLVARRFVGKQASFFALIFLAVPPLLLNKWSLNGNLNYPFLIIVGNLLLLLSHSLFYRRSGNSGLILAVGFLAGLGWWTNMLVLVYVVPFLWMLLRTGLIFRIKSFLFPLGVLLGSLPCWGYEWENFPSTRFNLYQGDGNPAPFISRVVTLARESLPVLLGIDTGGWSGMDALAGYGAALAVGLLVWALSGKKIVGPRDPSGEPGRQPGEGRGFLWLVFWGNLALILFTPRGNEIGGTGIRYLLPLYSLLPCWLGALLLQLWRRERAVALPVMAVLLGFSLWVNWQDTLGTIPPQERRWNSLKSRTDPLIRLLVDRNFREVYWTNEGDLPAFEFTFLAGMKIVAADPWREDYLPHATVVDAASAPLWVVWGGTGKNPEPRESLRALGYGVRETTIPPFKLIEPVSRGSSGYRTISPDRWKIKASENPTAAGLLLDRDVATRWSSGSDQKAGQWIWIDLGREDTVTRVDLLSLDWREVPQGFRIELSTDGLFWKEAVTVSDYWGPIFNSGRHPFLKVRRGRVQAIFSPSRARHIKITQTGRTQDRPWSIREIFVYQPVSANPVSETPAEILAVLKREGIHFLYSDHWLSALVRQASRGSIGTLPSNYYINSNGRSRPDPPELEPFQMTLGRAVWIGSDGEVEELRDPRSFPEGTIKEIDAGGHPLLLFKKVPPDDRPVLPGDRRVPFGIPQAGGQVPFLVVDLGQERLVKRVQVAVKKGSNPISWILEGSKEGEEWEGLESFRWSGPLYWTGSELLKNSEKYWDIRFPPKRWRVLRIKPSKETVEFRRVIEGIQCYE